MPWSRKSPRRCRASSDFFVIARNSAFAYKGRSVDVRQVGRELGVRYAVEGSVRRVGERVRITAQLVETETGNHIWSTKVDGAVSDLFDLQDKIAAEVASALQPSIRRAEVERARSQAARDAGRLRSRDARPAASVGAPHGRESAGDRLSRARRWQLEPNYGLAAALAAWAHGQQVAYNWATDVAAERAEGERLIEIATQTVGDDPTALTALASAMMQLGGDVRQALQLRRPGAAARPQPRLGVDAARLRPGLSRAARGGPRRPSSSRPGCRRSIRSRSTCISGMGLAHFAAGRPEQGIELARQALAERPGLTWPYRDLATYYAAAGKLEQARDALEKFVYLRPAMSAASLRDGLRFMEPALLDRYVGGLRAGRAANRVNPSFPHPRNCTDRCCRLFKARAATVLRRHCSGDSSLDIRLEKRLAPRRNTMIIATIVYDGGRTPAGLRHPQSAATAAPSSKSRRCSGMPQTFDLMVPGPPAAALPRRLARAQGNGRAVRQRPLTVQVRFIAAS